MKPFKCMLAGKAPENLGNLYLPTGGSYKYDGVRILIVEGSVYSRNMKLIPSEQVQEMFGNAALNGLDGEIIAGPPNAANCYRRTTSAAMAKTNRDDLSLYVFDDYEKPDWDHDLRLLHAKRKIGKRKNIVLVEHRSLGTVADVEAMEKEALDLGYEGLMLRNPYGKYKFGRSTDKEQGLLKLKRFDDSEAVIQECEELMHNDNDLQEDELGRAKRQSLKAGMRASGKLGAFCVQDINTGVTFNVGTGFSDVERIKFWFQRKSLLGKVIKYKFFPSGNKEKPRFPTFAGFRSSIDM